MCVYVCVCVCVRAPYLLTATVPEAEPGSVVLPLILEHVLVSELLPLQRQTFSNVRFVVTLFVRKEFHDRGSKYKRLCLEISAF